MKYTNFQAFEKHVRHSAPQHFSPIYLLITPDDFERQKAENLLRKEVLGSQMSSPYAFVQKEAESLPIQELKEELNTGDMFASRRVVLIQHLDALKKPQREYLEEYCLHPSAQLCLVCSAATFNRTTQLYKKMEKAGVIFDVEEKKPWELEKYLIEQVIADARVEGKSMDSSAAQLLVKQVGTNRSMLHQELEKLCCYVGNRTSITTQDIQAICANVPSETIWQLGDAIFQRDIKSVIRIGLALLDEGTPFLILLRQIRSQFQTKYQLCSIHAAGGSPADMAAQFPYMKGAILEKNLSMARAYGLERFKKGMMLIDETELLAKNSGSDTACLAERLFIKLTC
ncbi:DNA polymerase III subunit delta [Parachlamydia acanthamoebae]|uniref:DNA-directed DNA polymerase n=3 Tax=Parachlamydia acanthamoebae TaxID=83552 RepID=F8L064_PARAV|nr:DNA polymerase III subunit delta [Parachlamydia acanthamoebae]CCB86592.1 putative uncharacterized protein [Parachlamydia acanthamoebae UV-7]